MDSRIGSASNSGRALMGLLVLSLSATCAADRADDAVETRTGALTVLTFEAETLTRNASSPPGSTVTSEAGASGGQYVQLNASPAPVAGNWIEFTLPNIAAGTYDVSEI